MYSTKSANIKKKNFKPENKCHRKLRQSKYASLIYKKLRVHLLNPKKVEINGIKWCPLFDNQVYLNLLFIMNVSYIDGSRSVPVLIYD